MAVDGLKSYEPFNYFPTCIKGAIDCKTDFTLSLLKNDSSEGFCCKTLAFQQSHRSYVGPVIALLLALVCIFVTPQNLHPDQPEVVSISDTSLVARCSV